jgi:hypothetical protein
MERSQGEVVLYRKQQGWGKRVAGSTWSQTQTDS